MMNVQSIGCQPLKPFNSSSLKSQSFGNGDFNCYQEGDIEAIKRDRDEFQQMADNKDSKFLSSIGTFGMGVAAAAISFYTFKSMAPKGWQMLKSMYNGVANNSLVKKSVGFIKEKSVKFGKFISDKVVNFYNGIKPESTLGKVKSFVVDKLSWVSKKMAPVTAKVKSMATAAKEWLVKNQSRIKEGIKNTGATLVAIPAGITAVNSDLVKEGENE